VLRGGLLYTASAGGLDAAGAMPDRLEDRVAESVANLRSCCEGAGLTLAHVVYLQLFIGDIGRDYEAALAVLAAHFAAAGAAPPTRATVGVHRGAGFFTMNAVVATGSKRAVALPTAVFNNNGDFAPGVSTGGRLYVGGQLGRDPVLRLVPESPAEQARVGLRRFGEVLAAAGLDLQHVVSLSCATTLASPAAVAVVEAVVRDAFVRAGAEPPAGVVARVHELPEGAQLSFTGVATLALREKVAARPATGPAAMFSAYCFGGDACYLAADGDAAGPLASQLRQALGKLAGSLAAAGLGFEHVASAQLYLPAAEPAAVDMAALNAVYGEFFTVQPLPARTPVSSILAAGSLLQLALVAVRPGAAG
jgi:enamine deaminase RidA (YjgF/YER057c/UK114 family)